MRKAKLLHSFFEKLNIIWLKRKKKEAQFGLEMSYRKFKS